MAVLNAPWNLDQLLHEPLQAMARLLSQERPAAWRLHWLVQDGHTAASQSHHTQPLPSSRRPR
jgi:23S rRNA (adenine2030-N6)-methyltransferase